MSHIPTHPDQDLLSKVGGEGFPHFVMLDDEGTVLDDFYPQGIKDFEQSLQKSKQSEYLKSKTAFRANPKDNALRDKFLSQALELIPGEAILNEAIQLMEAGQLPEALSNKIKGKLTLKKIGEVFQEIESHFKAQPSQQEVLDFLGPKFYELYQKGYIPEEKPDNLVVNYWYCLANHAEKQKDITAFETAYNTLGRLFQGNQNPQVTALLSSLKTRLEMLKQGK